MEILPLTQEERKYTCPQSMQLQGQTGSIGRLQGILELQEQNTASHGQITGDGTNRMILKANWMGS